MSEFARWELQRFAAGRPTAITIGTFDGVHRGHQYLVGHVIERARALDMAAGVVTLYPNPAQVLRPQEPMHYLSSLEERIELLSGLGLDVVAPLSFTSELAELSATEFAALLQDELDMQLLIMGPDNRFGRGREGTPERMSDIGKELGFRCEVLPEALLQQTRPISSTAIRTALATGDIETVETLLGRRYSLRGPVVKGDQRGRQLGFPTANISVTADRCLPAYGVYATWAFIGGKRYASATNIGLRPTFDGKQTSVETYVFDYEGDLYERQVRIELVARLRPEMKFDGLDEIRAQIDRDVARAHEILAAQG